MAGDGLIKLRVRAVCRVVEGQTRARGCSNCVAVGVIRVSDVNPADRPRGIKIWSPRTGYVDGTKIGLCTAAVCDDAASPIRGCTPIGRGAIGVENPSAICARQDNVAAWIIADWPDHRAAVAAGA